MIVRFLFATVFAIAVSVALWAGASALINERTIVLSDDPRLIDLGAGAVEIDGPSAGECPPNTQCIPPDPPYFPPAGPPPPPSCVAPECIIDHPPPLVTEYDPNPTVPLVMVPPRDFEQCTLPGAVTVQIIVGPDGGRGTVTVTGSTDPCLNRPSVAAADKWLFGPSESQLPRVITHTFTYE